MTDRCLIAASLAVLVFHPSSTIRCFKPKSSPNSPQKEKTTPLSKPYRTLKKALSMTKSKKGPDSRTASPAVSRSSSTLSSAGASSPLSGEVFFDPVSELIAGRKLTGIVEKIFRSGWAAEEIGVTVKKVLKVNNGADVLHRFEEYREMVRSKAKESRAAGLRSERLEADGNEVLMFHGTVIACSLGFDNGGLGVCSEKDCGVCRFIGSTFDCLEETAGTSSTWLCGNSWKAHERVATECTDNGSSRKAIILCKVIAGRVVRARKHGLIDGEMGGFDSVVRSTEDDRSDGSEELMVLNPKAILPCFVIVYNVREGAMS